MLVFDGASKRYANRVNAMIVLLATRLPAGHFTANMISRARLHDTLFVLVGVVGLVLKGRADNWLILSYGGNIAASFSTFFLLKLPGVPPRFQAPTAIGFALLATELFEATNGFGFMSNTYDPTDFLANAGGVALAAIIDTAIQFASRLRGGSDNTSRLRG